MEHENLPEPYGNQLNGCMQEVEAVASTMELQIMEQRVVLAGLKLHGVRLFQAKIEAQMDLTLERLFVKIGLFREEASEKDARVVFRVRKQLTKEDQAEITGHHMGLFRTVCQRLERYADKVLQRVFLLLYSLVDQECANQLQHKTMYHKTDPQGNFLPPVGRAKVDAFVRAGAGGLLLLSTMHAAVVLVLMPDLSIGHALVFLAINLVVMLVRLTDLVLMKRNGSFEKALHVIETALSIGLIILLCLHCLKLLLLTEERTPDIWMHCAGELTLGLIAVFAFHKLVSVVIVRLRDWIDRDRRY